MDNKIVKPMFEAEFKLRSMGSEQTYPEQYTKISFTTQKEMEAWVDQSYELGEDDPEAKYYSVTDLETGYVIYRNFTKI